MFRRDQHEENVLCHALASLVAKGIKSVGLNLWHKDGVILAVFQHVTVLPITNGLIDLNLCSICFEEKWVQVDKLSLKHVVDYTFLTLIIFFLNIPSRLMCTCV
jgi:hypothetical protein